MPSAIFRPIVTRRTRLRHNLRRARKTCRANLARRTSRERGLSRSTIRKARQMAVSAGPSVSDTELGYLNPGSESLCCRDGSDDTGPLERRNGTMVSIARQEL
jgi:hypothetical protein